MPRLLTTLPLIALLAATGAHAQDTATPEKPATGAQTAAPAQADAPAEPAAETDAAPAADGQVITPDEGTADTGLALGEDVSDEARGPGRTYVSETNGAWELQCITVQEGDDPCQMYQLLKDDDGNAVAEVSMFRLPAGGQAVAGATVVVPLETLLTQQLTLAVDSGAAKRYPFSFCNPVGCYARIGLTSADVAAFKRGANVKVTIVPFAAPDQKVTLDMSLSGFTATYDKASVIAN